MTHNELLALINDEIEVCEPECNQHQRVNAPWLALCAVVEMHKPFEGYCNVCISIVEPSFLNPYPKPTFYPCPTIQAIEKELA